MKEKQDGDDSIGIEFLSNLDRHSKPVNVVSFSPNGMININNSNSASYFIF